MRPALVLLALFHQPVSKNTIALSSSCHRTRCPSALCCAGKLSHTVADPRDGPSCGMARCGACLGGSCSDTPFAIRGVGIGCHLREDGRTVQGRKGHTRRYWSHAHSRVEPEPSGISSKLSQNISLQPVPYPIAYLSDAAGRGTSTSVMVGQVPVMRSLPPSPWPGCVGQQFQKHACPAAASMPRPCC